MVIGDKFKRCVRPSSLAQGDIEKRTGCCVAIFLELKTAIRFRASIRLRRLARAMEIPMYRIFTDEVRIKKPNVSFQRTRTRSTKSRTPSLFLLPKRSRE